jgi:hypothetical protein
MDSLGNANGVTAGGALLILPRQGIFGRQDTAQR